MFQLPQHIPIIDGAYIVGGSVRDMLLKRTPVDYDIAVSENPENYAQRLADNVNGHIVFLGKGNRSMIRVVSADQTFDITPLNGADIESDLLQRDFTVNAIAYELLSGKIIDIAAGRNDLEQKRIRLVSVNAFEKDPLRMLRAFRMAACLKFEIEPATLSGIQTNAALIETTAGERIYAELVRMLQSQNAYSCLVQMQDTGLLFALLPELTPSRNCRQGGYHDYNVLQHSMYAFEQLESLFNFTDPFLSQFEQRHIACIQNDRVAILKLAILLHDIGKPATRSVDPRGAVHFYNHTRKSAEMAATICKRLKFSNKDKQFVDFIIRSHLMPLSLQTLQATDKSRQTRTTRFFIKCGEYTPYLLMHALADHRSKSDQGKNDSFQTFIADLLRVYFCTFCPASRQAPLITGKELISDFGLSPSPRFKKILERIEEAHLSKQINTREEACRLVEKILTT